MANTPTQTPTPSGSPIPSQKPKDIPVSGVPPKPENHTLVPGEPEVFDSIKAEQDAGRKALNLFQAQGEAEARAGKAAVERAQKIEAARKAYVEAHQGEGQPAPIQRQSNPLHGN